jgi:hypothetical protein
MIWYNPRNKKFEFGRKSTFEALKDGDPWNADLRVLYQFPASLQGQLIRLCNDLNRYLSRKSMDGSIPFT